MIYLDNAGTTKMSPSVKNTMLPYFDEIYGNASSLHSIGQTAKEHLEKSRQEIATILSGETFKYEIAIIKKPYNHSRMGRTATKTIPVTEVVILAKLNK